MDVPIIYKPRVFREPDVMLNALRKLDWCKRGSTPRHEYYCNDFPAPYTYGSGEGRRTYDPRPYTEAITQIRVQVETVAKCKFEVCFLNMYLDQKDQLGWHADDSPEMDDARPIAIVSFGVEREIWFRLKHTRDPDEKYGLLGTWHEDREVTKLKLENGSVCLMKAGMQDVWQHRIPKASFLCGTRISLTFRGYVPTL